MADSVYKIIELVGTNKSSFEKAAASAINRAAKSLRDLRIAEVSALDVVIEDGKIQAYRAKVKVSFKYEDAPVAPEPPPAPKKVAAKKAPAKKAPAKKKAKRRAKKKKKG